MTAAPCPHEADPELLDCPRGCGFVTLARPSLKWGPWRMQLHLLNPRCSAPIPGSTGTYRRHYVPPSARNGPGPDARNDAGYRP
ncbi:hypothetical protein BST13_33780 [Mycobacterium aquaticum]|uniref:Uncharacterized protein n=1 Tax=Mycobacterium aquaticum TaxID=1927124 RepID=A0A1X0A4C4_9MYCO|nr:hypothetical protein BST13_33780 [Mycobacterium aquaticum]